MYYLETGYDKHDRLRNAILLAVAAHAALIFGISFDAYQAQHYNRQIEVTLATKPSTAAPEDASHVAQVNQQASGDQADIAQVTSRNKNLPNSAQPPQQTLLQKTQARAVLQQEVVTNTAAARRAVQAQQTAREEQQTDLQGISPEVDRLNQQLSGLEAELECLRASSDSMMDLEARLRAQVARLRVEAERE